METKEQKVKNTHHGHAIKRFRRTLGIKQEALAAGVLAAPLLPRLLSAYSTSTGAGRTKMAALSSV